MSDSPRDDLPDPLVAQQAAIDQLVAGAGEMARAAFGLYGAFTGEGFTEPQALYLTATMLLQDAGDPPS